MFILGSDQDPGMELQKPSPSSSPRPILAARRPPGSAAGLALAGRAAWGARAESPRLARRGPRSADRGGSSSCGVTRSEASIRRGNRFWVLG